MVRNRFCHLCLTVNYCCADSTAFSGGSSTFSEKEQTMWTFLGDLSGKIGELQATNDKKAGVAARGGGFFGR
jgi:hypothetical protein